MAWRRHDPDPGPLPAWVATFTETDWADDHADAAWPEHTRWWHRQNRWHAARNAWLGDHPAHADRELRECIEECGGQMSDFGLA